MIFSHVLYQLSYLGNEGRLIRPAGRPVQRQKSDECALLLAKRKPGSTRALRNQHDLSHQWRPFALQSQHDTVSRLLEPEGGGDVAGPAHRPLSYSQ